MIPAFLSGRIDEIVAGFGSGGRLLDVGFGAGMFLEAARRAGWLTAGVDVSLAAITHARELGLDVFHGTLAEAAYPDASFDVVVATEILEHVSDVRPLLDQIVRVLRPGGLLWATTPHARGVSGRLLGSTWSVVSPPEHVQLFSISGLQKLLRASGFQTVAVAAEGLNPQEILDSLRRRRTSRRQRIASGHAINAFFLEGTSRRAVKRTVNRILTMLRLGDSLKISART